jgi:hypothetical protein
MLRKDYFSASDRIYGKRVFYRGTAQLIASPSKIRNFQTFDASLKQSVFNIKNETSLLRDTAKFPPEPA